VQEGHGASQAVSRQRQNQTLNTVAATTARNPGNFKSAFEPATTSQQETRAMPKQLGKRRRGSSRGFDDIAETAPPLKRHQHKAASPRASQGPSPSSQGSSAQEPASAPLHLPQARAPVLTQNGADLGMEYQKQDYPVTNQLGKRRREAAPSLEDFVDIDLAQPLKRQHMETAEASSIAGLRKSSANLGGRPLIQGTQHPQYARSPPRPQQLPRSQNQQKRPAAPQCQSVEPACGGYAMPARQVTSLKSHIGSQNSVPLAKPSQASFQQTSRWDPRRAIQPSPSQSSFQDPSEGPQTTGRSIPHEASSQRRPVRRHADLYQIEIDGKPYQLPPPLEWMDEEVETWKAQMSNLPQQLPPQQSDAGSLVRMKQIFPSGAPPQTPVTRSANGRDMLTPNGPFAYQSSVGQPSGSQPRPTNRAAAYEGAEQQQAHLSIGWPDGRHDAYVTEYRYGNSKGNQMQQMVTSQQLSLNCQSPAKAASNFPQEAPLLNGSNSLANIHGQLQYNGGQGVRRSGPAAESPFSDHPHAIPPFQLGDITIGYNEQSRAPERQSVLATQPWSNDSNSFRSLQHEVTATPEAYTPALPRQEFYPFSQATNRVPSQMQTNKSVSQSRPNRLSQRPIRQPPPPFPVGSEQSSSNGETLARDEWEILEAQNAQVPVKVTNGSYRAVQLRAAAASGRKRDFESTLVDTTSVVDELPSHKKLRIGCGSTQSAPSKSKSNGNAGHPFHSSGSERSPSRLSQPRPYISYTQRAAAGSPASSRNVTRAPHTHPGISTAETTRPVDDLQPGHGTMETPIEIDVEVPQKSALIEIDDEVLRKPQVAPDVNISAASLESKSGESANADQESIEPSIGSWNDVKPWENDDELDDYLAKELADFPDDVEAEETPPDGQTDETTAASAAAADPIREPIFSNFRDQRPKTVADEIAVNKAIQHTYHDLGHKVAWDVVDAAFAEKVREATTESYGHQYNTLQAIYVDKLVGKDYLATTKRKSKKQKKAERDVGFLYVG